MSRNITDVSAPTTMSWGVRTNCLSVRPATAATVVTAEAEPAGRATAGRVVGDAGATAVELVRSRTVMAAPSSQTAVGSGGDEVVDIGRVDRRTAGQGEEDLVQRRTAQPDVVEGDALVGEPADGVGETGRPVVDRDGDP